MTKAQEKQLKESFKDSLKSKKQVILIAYDDGDSIKVTGNISADDMTVAKVFNSAYRRLPEEAQGMIDLLNKMED